MPETVLGIHIELNDADKATLDNWLDGSAAIQFIVLMDLLSRATNIKITRITQNTLEVVSETQIYPSPT